jgi:mannonate dehydratase
MKETWRWFGPQDNISLDQIRQTGATGVVTALHQLYRGEPWPLQQVLDRKEQIEAEGLVWSVVESIPVHNSIKLRTGPYRQYIEWWKDSLIAVARAGVKVVCYNFMPVVDWTRTDLKWRLPSGGYALRFDLVDFAAYDLFILERKDAAADYSDQQVASARARLDGMSVKRRQELEWTIISGLPAAEAAYDREKLRRALVEYEGISAADLRANLVAFLKEVAPVAQENGIRLAIHPDDPPWPLFGLPRVVSTADDARAILAACDMRANGLTFCVGSYGARANNDLLSMVREFAPRIHFVHLRQVTRETERTFHEAEHLGGSSDMVGVIHALLMEEKRRQREDKTAEEIPMRPDHGHLLATDRDREANPGYSLIGRLKGLAELRGVMRGLEYAADPSPSAQRFEQETTSRGRRELS